MQLRFKRSSIPNYLTVFRIILVPIILAFMLVDFGPKYNLNIFDVIGGISFSLSWILAGVLFVIASITDFLDGYLSRKYNWVSDFGKLWDPIADKILVNSVLIVFAGANLHGDMKVFFIIPIIMIIRDTIVDAYRMYASSKNVVVAANIYGKLKTVSQLIGIILIFFIFKIDYSQLSSTTSKLIWWLAQNGFMWISLGLSVSSGVIYACQITKKLKANKLENTK